VYRKYYTLMETFSRQYADKQLDMNGVFMYEKLNDAKEFFHAHREPQNSYSNEDMKTHTVMADTLYDGINMVFEWAKTAEEVNAVREATIDLTMWYGVDSLRSSSEKKMNFVEEYKAVEEDMPEEIDTSPRAPVAPKRAKEPVAQAPAAVAPATDAATPVATAQATIDENNPAIKDLMEQMAQMKMALGIKPVGENAEAADDAQNDAETAEDAPETEADGDVQGMPPATQLPPKKAKKREY